MNKHIALALAGLITSGATLAGEVVVIVNRAAAEPTKQQVTDVYLGRSRLFTPLDHPEDSSIRADFYRKATDRDLAQVKAAWSRLVFTGRGQPPKDLPDAAAVKRAVAADPKAIGYIDKSALDASVKAAFTLN